MKAKEHIKRTLFRGSRLRTWPTGQWWAEEAVDFLGPVLAVSGRSCRQGNYELRLVVYNLETLVPAVELGVWEAETTLARLRLAETQ